MKGIIGFSGKSESGKDTAAKILKDKLVKGGKRVVILHNADYLKFICKEYFGWNGRKTKKGRTLLQQIGTEKVRAKYPDFWIHTVVNFILAFEDDFDYFLIADCRFRNEYEYLKKCNFPLVSVGINRVGHENSLTPEQRTHESEVALNDYKFDVVMNVGEGIEFVEMAIDQLIAKIINN